MGKREMLFISSCSLGCLQLTVHSLSHANIMYEVPKPSQVYLRPQETDDEETPVVIHSQNKYQLAEQRQQGILNLLRVNMSYLFDSTPSPLPIANPPHVQSSTIGRNNFEAAKSSRSRLKERVSEPNEERTARHRINNPKRQEHLGFADTREIAHSNRKDELKTVLNPILADGVNHLVILCWGDKDCCHIVPVNIGNEADEVNAWESIREAWYERRGNWRKYIPFYGVRQVDVVEVCHGDLQGKTADDCADILFSLRWRDTALPVSGGLYPKPNMLACIVWTAGEVKSRRTLQITSSRNFRALTIHRQVW